MTGLYRDKLALKPRAKPGLKLKLKAKTKGERVNLIEEEHITHFYFYNFYA